MEDYTATTVARAVIYSNGSEESVAENPVEVTARWKGHLGFESKNSQGATVRMDSPSDGASPSPMELVLMALAGCTGMDVVSVLEKKRQPVEAMDIRVRGTRAEDHPQIYTAIEVEYLVSGAHLTAEAVARAIELSMTKYCSVGGMLAKAASLTTSFKILPMEGRTHE
jgi:putative redox protein